MMSHVVAPSSFLVFLLRMPHLAQFPLSLAAAGSCHWLATTTIRRRRRAGHCQEALEPPAFWLPFVGILRRCLMTFDAADRIFSPLLLFFFACILFFNFVKRMPDIVSPSHSSPPTRFVCFWRPPRGTFNVPQGHVIKYVSKAAAGGI